MIAYLGNKYKDINDLAKKLGVSPVMAAHLFHSNGGEYIEKESKDVLTTKEDKTAKKTK